MNKKTLLDLSIEFLYLGAEVFGGKRATTEWLALIILLSFLLVTHFQITTRLNQRTEYSPRQVVVVPDLLLFLVWILELFLVL